jgi:hypothetical protein
MCGHQKKVHICWGGKMFGVQDHITFKYACQITIWCWERCIDSWWHFQDVIYVLKIDETNIRDRKYLKVYDNALWIWSWSLDSSVSDSSSMYRQILTRWSLPQIDTIIPFPYKSCAYKLNRNLKGTKNLFGSNLGCGGRFWLPALASTLLYPPFNESSIQFEDKSLYWKRDRSISALHVVLSWLTRKNTLKCLTANRQYRMSRDREIAPSRRGPNFDT